MCTTLFKVNCNAWMCSATYLPVSSTHNATFVKELCKCYVIILNLPGSIY